MINPRVNIPTMGISPPAQVIYSSKPTRSLSASTCAFRIHASKFVQKGISTGLVFMKILPALVEIYPLSDVIWRLIVIHLPIIPTW